MHRAFSKQTIVQCNQTPNNESFRLENILLIIEEIEFIKLFSKSLCTDVSRQRLSIADNQ